ncbi:hypothetical protein J2W25_002106 [Variovorax boronicumulans]|uniref:Microcin J25-processing protein McjB C-terminal domain-containing protein n=2 Tax=Variovorax boronicumulans TaxID=436515 RepID=A0AAW8DU64_9BURK|nr:lasso peptide biosynthesis B2 protein [Variovorax boronicumulans]MDP9877801.1 hypothetical protein [Variovorax boronicumulans]MDP9923085.1 hypothetical protein [Variovorax boronicumulans]
MHRLDFGPCAHHLLLEGELIILDEIADKYMLLDQQQSNDILDALTSGKESVTSQYLQSLGVLVHNPTSATPKIRVVAHYKGADNLTWAQVFVSSSLALRPILLTAAIYYLARAKTLLRRSGFHQTLQNLRALKELARVRPSPSLSPRALKRIEAAIHTASRLSLTKAQCLETSVAIAMWLYEKGIPCDFLIGVQRYDFLSHAWVELDGIPIGNEQRISQHLPKIVSI